MFGKNSHSLFLSLKLYCSQQPLEDPRIYSYFNICHSTYDIPLKELDLFLNDGLEQA